MASNLRTAAAAAAAALLLAAAPARADLIRLFDGRTIEGKATQGSGKWTIKGYKGKSSTYAASEVKFVEPGECSWDVAARMIREIPADASDTLFVEKHLEVAHYLHDRMQYCSELHEMERKELEAILKKVPDHREARLGLGHVEWGKWWFKTEKERDAFRKGAPPAQMEPLGYVKYRKTGLWELKEDVEAMEAGKVKYRGKWMTEDEKKQAQGYLKDEKGNWVLARDIKDRQRREEVEKALGEKPVTVTSSDHFRLISWFNTGDTAKLKDLAERTFAAHHEVLGLRMPKGEEEGEVLFADPIEVALLVAGERKDKWIDAYAKGLGWNDETIQFYKNGGGWSHLHPYPNLVISGSPTEKNRPRNPEEDFEFAKSRVTSMVARILLDRVRPGQPAWLMEGNAFLGEIRMNETAECCYVTSTKYREEVANKQGSKAKYFEFMRKQVEAGLDRSLRQIFSLDLNDLDWADSVKSWSFLEYLLAKYPSEYRLLVRRPFPEVEEIQPAHIQAAVDGMKPKDPSAAPLDKNKEVKPVRDTPMRVSGPGAEPVTEGSPEEKAVRVASAEAWLASAIAKDFPTLDREWRDWILAHR